MAPCAADVDANEDGLENGYGIDRVTGDVRTGENAFVNEPLLQHRFAYGLYGNENAAVIVAVAFVKPAGSVDGVLRLASSVPELDF